MTTITPCLWFDGNGLEAAEHYVSVIPDSRITDVSYYGPDQPGEQGKVMTKIDIQALRDAADAAATD